MQTKSAAKKTLIQCLKERFPESTRATHMQWITQGRIQVNGAVCFKRLAPIAADDTVHLGPRLKWARHDLKILFEDLSLVVVDKPAGLLSVETEYEQGLSAHTLLKQRFHRRRVFPVHRLDRATSGLLVFAYTASARDHLKSQLAQRTMKREYLAVVEGHPPSQGQWHSFLREGKDLRVVCSTPQEGKEAITSYTCLRHTKKHALLRLALATGRKHQIRVQAADAGFPLVGDEKYGSTSSAPLQLQAVELELVHPKSGRTLHWQIGNRLKVRLPR